MLKVDCEVSDGHMRCARRSSAALRTALQQEENSRSNNRALTSTAIVQFDTNGMVSRLRRDVKAVYDQVGGAVACGDQPLVSVRLVGRVINVFRQFYSLCCYCGCICTVEQNNRYGSEICCLRCDLKMLYRDNRPAATAPTTVVKCRYCGREDPKTSNSARFKIVKAPRDAIGHNASLPQPLRWVAFCTAHWKPWLQSALDVMNMTEVFSHISQRCRPIFAAAGSKRAIEYSGETTTYESGGTRKKSKAMSVTRVLKKDANGRKGIAKRKKGTHLQ